MISVVEAEVRKRLGGLPAAVEILRRLDVAGIVDERCPVRSDADLTHGQVIEVLIANRLTSPMPLQRVGDWASAWAVEETFGVEAELLNDDRLARALDAVAPHLAEISGTVAATAISGFGIDVAKIHWDMTSMSMSGAYPEPDQDPAFPQIKHGHPKDRRFDLKQVQAGIAVAGDGGIPVFSKVFDGGAAEVSQVVDTMKALKEIAGPRRFLMVADSKLVSWANVTALCAAEVDFTAPLPAARVADGFYAGLDLDAARIVDHVPARAKNSPADRRDVYRVLEDTVTLAGPRKKDTPVTLRRVLVHSTGNAAGQQQARDKHLAKAAAELDKLAAGAGGRYYNTSEKISARAGVIAKTRRVAKVLHTITGTHPDTGKPTFTWWFDTEALTAETAADGWYALVAPLPAPGGQTRAAEQILLDYKCQSGVERRYADFKGPLAVTPVFVQKNSRVAALIQVICLALLVFCLIEREVRRALGGDGKMAGLYPDSRRVAPTARIILYTLSILELRIGNIMDPPTVVFARGIHVHLLELLGIEVIQPRWTHT
ncbi:IS1634 family transposase [Streptomyces sp. NBC_00536]|uniref:IS1634 family transposase n=1 Tax=Streptomyces sp. NBC_00536 TaxID=2975769 RepID=UPI002E7FCD8C|nr:IS1634 family transposase [Streptomyces sp. NBC_00536]WUC83341.1 IS1634 family transposase [Streptomyces sp. NBC_00536]